jgi:hypothetical protein
MDSLINQITENADKTIQGVQNSIEQKQNRGIVDVSTDLTMLQHLEELKNEKIMRVKHFQEWQDRILGKENNAQEI